MLILCSVTHFGAATIYALSETTKSGKNSGRIFRFSASGTTKTGPANTKEPTGTFWLLFVPAKSNWRAHTMQKATTEPTSVTIHHLKSQKKKASNTLAFSLENN